MPYYMLNIILERICYLYYVNKQIISVWPPAWGMRLEKT